MVCNMEYPGHTKVVMFDSETEEFKVVGYEKNDMEKIKDATEELARFENYAKTVKIPCFGWR